MNFLPIINEIGILETNRNIERYLDNRDLIEEISKDIPIPEFGSTNWILNNAVKKMISYGKENIFMLSNEIAFVEQLSLYKGYFNNIIVGLSRSLSCEQINNIKKNTPSNIDVSYINELEYPKIVKPKTSILIAFGYASFNNCFITKETYRMIELYNRFLGKKVFLKCNIRSAFKPKEWVSIKADNYFDEVL